MHFNICGKCGVGRKESLGGDITNLYFPMLELGLKCFVAFIKGDWVEIEG